MPIMKPLLALAVFLSLLFVFGCSKDEEEEGNQINFNLIESEKTLPADFHEIAYERDTTPYFQYLVKKVANLSEFEETWNLYGFENKILDVDFNEKEIIFIGVQESGSCPYQIENIKVSPDKKALTVPLSEPDGACTSDATPRTFIIEIDKQVSEGLENLIMIQSGTETAIPIDVHPDEKIENVTRKEGYILKVEEGNVLVAEHITSEKYEEIKNKTTTELHEEGLALISVSYDDTSSLKTGNKVEIWLEGGIKESYPEQAEASKIEIID